MRSRERSVAQQIFVLQILTVLLVVGVAVSLAYVDARRDQLASARIRSVNVAETVADSPNVLRALDDPDPSRRIQPYAERVRRDTGTDFVVVMDLDRTRFSHPNPEQLGKRFIGDLGGAPQGRRFTQQYTGTLGPSMRAVVPVHDGDRVVAMVSVGITLARIDRELQRGLLPIAVAGGLVLAVGAAGAWLISRRLRRQTHGMGAAAITRMYEYYDSVLHAVHEGLLLVDEHDRVQLVNDEAHRLLDLGPDAVGRRLEELDLPETLTRALLTGDAGPDQIHIVGSRVLLVNQADAHWQGRAVGSVVTLRDHTELQAVTGELDSVRGLAEALRSQNHEASNRLHTVVSLIELGRVDDAVRFATEELETAQLLTDVVVGSVQEPVVAAVLLGKSAQAAERGIDLDIDEDTRVSDLLVEPRDVVTILGNLLDNAFDAVGSADDKQVHVLVQADGAGLVVEVDDSGAGLPEDVREHIFRRGWSTKRGDGAVGRGLGLALVGQVVRRYGGVVEVGDSPLGGARFAVRIGGSS